MHVFHTALFFKTAFSKARYALSWLVVAPVRAYQYFISPLMPASCRFYPSCSQYTREAIHRHGACHGGLIALKRLARCHPFGGSGFDPVPEKPAQPRRNTTATQRP
jgi:putative membrane protein insertion efficiency factor